MKPTYSITGMHNKHYVRKNVLHYTRVVNNVSLNSDYGKIVGNRSLTLKIIYTIWCILSKAAKSFQGIKLNS